MSGQTPVQSCPHDLLTAEGLEAFVKEVHGQLHNYPTRAVLRTFMLYVRRDPIHGERVDPPGILTVIEFPRTEDELMAEQLRAVAEECRAAACLSIMLCARAEGDALGRVAYVHEDEAVVALRVEHERSELHGRTWLAPAQEPGTENMSIGELTYEGTSNTTSPLASVLPPKAN